MENECLGSSVEASVKECIKRLLSAEKIAACAFLDAAFLRVLLPEKMPEGIHGAALFLIPYYTGDFPERNVSLYSVGKDYHLFSRALAQKILPSLSDAFPDERFYVFCDSSPIDERKAAAESGLGVIGRNRLLIHKTYGSYVFIGSILTTARFSDRPTAAEHCLECGKCSSACAFLRGETDVCSSELNQRKQLTDEELAAVRARKIRWGCDVCQEVCPMNRNLSTTPIDFFYEDRLPVLTTARLDSMSKKEFSERAYAWRGKKTIRRNLESANDTENG